MPDKPARTSRGPIEVPIDSLRELSTGDVVIQPAIGRPPGGVVVRRMLELRLPTRPHTVIGSTWRNSGGIADFQATLYMRQNLVNSYPLWVTDDGSEYTPEQLVELIDYYDLLARPV